MNRKNVMNGRKSETIPNSTDGNINTTFSNFLSFQFDFRAKNHQK